MSPLTPATKPKTIVVFGGGTMMHVRNHMALCAPAYGTTARKIAMLLDAEDYCVKLRLTKMADPASNLETNDDVEKALREVLDDPNTVGIVFNVALCDFSGQIGDIPSGKYADRLQTRDVTEKGLALTLRPTKKLLMLIHQLRPDIVSVGFKTTANESMHIQVEKCNRMAAETKVSWMFANDTVTRNNMVLRRGHQDALYNGNERNNALLVLTQALLQDLRRK